MRTRWWVVVAALFVSFNAAAEDIDAEYRALVDEVLEITGAIKIGEQMGEFMATELFRVLRTNDLSVPDRAYDILAEEISAIMKEELNAGSFNEMMYPVYHKYLTATDLQALIDFYSSPEGKKIAELLPQISQEGMMAGQQWGLSLSPKIQERIRTRLEEEGITIR